MVAGSVTAMTGRPEHVGIETIPHEILSKIFSFALDDDCDLHLMLTSRPMARKLQDHAIIRTISGLLTTDQVRMVFHPHVQPDINAEHHAPLRRLDGGTFGRAPHQDKLIKTNWCSASFVGRVQIMLIKRVLKTYWDPLLGRDGIPPSAISHEYIWAELDDFEKNPAALRSEWLIESRADAVNGRYPWVRVYVWPRQGRVLIRDQLLNGMKQYQVPLLERFLQLQSSSNLDPLAEGDSRVLE